MLHHKPDTFKTAPPTGLTAIERKKARQYIAGARKAGLVVFPWHGSCIKTPDGWVPNTDSRLVGTTGQDDTGPNDFSAASDRFRRTRACRAADGLRQGVIFYALCEDFGVDPADPAMCDKVNAKMRAEAAAREARA